MQQTQYHGIASYKFEYQLSTGGDWQTALDTTQSTATSYNYTYGNLTGGKGYNLRVTVTDKAGNTGTGTNTANTKKAEKNPGGVINNIVSDDIKVVTPNSDLTTIGRNPVKYTYEEKTAHISASLAGIEQEIRRDSER